MSRRLYRPVGHGYRLRPGYPRARRCHQLVPGKGQGDQLRTPTARALADRPRPGKDDANIRARAPGPGPGSCASAGSASGDPASPGASTVCSWQPCAGRESDSHGSIPPRAHCRSCCTGKRRLSLGFPPLKEWTACPRGQAKKKSGPFAQPRLVAAVAAGVRSNTSTVRRGRPRR
jgi:hypothetical protein